MRYTMTGTYTAPTLGNIMRDAPAYSLGAFTALTDGWSNV